MRSTSTSAKSAHHARTFTSTLLEAKVSLVVVIALFVGAVSLAMVLVAAGQSYLNNLKPLSHASGVTPSYGYYGYLNPKVQLDPSSPNRVNPSSSKSTLLSFKILAPQGRSIATQQYNLFFVTNNRQLLSNLTLFADNVMVGRPIPRIKGDGNVTFNGQVKIPASATKNFRLVADVGTSNQADPVYGYPTPPSVGLTLQSINYSDIKATSMEGLPLSRTVYVSFSDPGYLIGTLDTSSTQSSSVNNTDIDATHIKLTAEQSSSITIKKISIGAAVGSGNSLKNIRVFDSSTNTLLTTIPKLNQKFSDGFWGTGEIGGGLVIAAGTSKVIRLVTDVQAKPGFGFRLGMVGMTFADPAFFAGPLPLYGNFINIIKPVICPPGKTPSPYELGVCVNTQIDPPSPVGRVGQLVNVQGTVYLVGDKGLMGIPSLAIFNSWCFKFTDVVMANAIEASLKQVGVLEFRAPQQTLPAGASKLVVSTCPPDPSPVVTCEYPTPPQGCHYIQSPDYNPKTQCGQVLQCLPSGGGSGGGGGGGSVSSNMTVNADYDGDGKTDTASWNTSSGIWTVTKSSTGLTSTTQWGTSGDVPIPRDFDGDHKADLGIWRPSTGTWWIYQSSTSGGINVQWGTNGDMPAPRDYDGDGKTDMAVLRPSTLTWWIINSSDNSRISRQWGLAGDIPAPKDYTGDGKVDIAMWRPSNGILYIVDSTTGVMITRVTPAPTESLTP